MAEAIASPRNCCICRFQTKEEKRRREGCGVNIRWPRAPSALPGPRHGNNSANHLPSSFPPAGAVILKRPRSSEVAGLFSSRGRLAVGIGRARRFCRLHCCPPCASSSTESFRDERSSLKLASPRDDLLVRVVLSR